MSSEVPVFYRKSSDGVHVMDAPNGCEYPLRYSDYPHDVASDKKTDLCRRCPKCGRCHMSHSGSHDFTGMMRLPDGRIVADPLHVAVQGARGHSTLSPLGRRKK